MKTLDSLQTKLTLSFIVLVGVVSTLSFALTYSEARRALKEVTQTELLATASVIAHDLSGAAVDSMAALQPGDEGSETFLHLRDQLKGIRASHGDLKYLYTMRRTPEGVVFMVDADYGNEDDPGAAIGEVYDDVAGRLMEGFERPAVDDDFTTDEWGTLLSGYAPIRNSQGVSVGLLGVDMASDQVVAKQSFIGTTVLYTTAAGVLLAGLLVLLFSRTIIRDIRQLSEAANAISMGNMDAGVDVERRDEIGELAASFRRMVASLKIMMLMGKEP